MKKYFVMSDIHSFYNEMITALKLKHFDDKNPDHILVVCGDLFDRGPDTVKVFEFAKSLAEQGRFIYVRGNHEDMLFECIEELKMCCMGHHHVTNGTFSTIVQFTEENMYDLYLGLFDRTKFAMKIAPLVNFINEYAVDYYEIDDHVFVHGWIPCEPVLGKVKEDWREGNWNQARWLNGMACWHKGAKVEGKTIVCGHWHCSWGHSHLDRKRKEFPDKNRKDWLESFKPYIKEGIVAIDACTAYSRICNCYVIER